MLKVAQLLCLVTLDHMMNNNAGKSEPPAVSNEEKEVEAAAYDQRDDENKNKD